MCSLHTGHMSSNSSVVLEDIIIFNLKQTIGSLQLSFFKTYQNSSGVKMFSAVYIYAGRLFGFSPGDEIVCYVNLLCNIPPWYTTVRMVTSRH